MPTFYLDFVNGNDVNDGSDWAHAWKTITSGPTAARIAPGDTIRIAKSPDPTSLGQSATWTDGSNVVTLTSAVTAEICDCDVQWTQSANVTSMVNSTIHKEGTGCAKHVFASGFTTGLASYFALGGATDFSAYQQVSLWVRSTVALAAGTLSLRLCSDAVGAVTVDTIAIPAINGANRWQVVTVDTAGALGASIQSIALYADIDPGTPTVYLDNIIACKASASVDSLTLASLISKNSAAQGGTEAWWPLKSIVGTTVILGGETNRSRVSDHPKYAGDTESVTTYKREAIDMGGESSETGSANIAQDSGTVTSQIAFEGGYNTSTSLQDGETFIDGRNGNGRGVYIPNGKTDITIERCNAIRWYLGLYFHEGTERCEILNCQTLGACDFGLRGLGYNGIAQLLQNIIACSSHGIYLESNGKILEIGTIAGDGGNGAIANGIRFDDVRIFEICDCGKIAYQNYGIHTGIGDGIKIQHGVIRGSNTASIYHAFADAAGIIDLYNCKLEDAVEVVLSTLPIPHRVRSQRHDQIAGNHYIFDAHGTIKSQDSVRHTASGIAWEISPTSEDKREEFPLEMSLCRIACEANKQVTVNAWLRRDHATDIEGRIIIKGGTIQGVSADVSDSLTAAADTWEELEIQFTPTEAEVAEVFVQAYYPDSVSTYTYTVYVDDVTITQA